MAGSNSMKYNWDQGILYRDEGPEERSGQHITSTHQISSIPRKKIMGNSRHKLYISQYTKARNNRFEITFTFGKSFTCLEKYYPICPSARREGRWHKMSNEKRRKFSYNILLYWYIFNLIYDNDKERGRILWSEAFAYQIVYCSVTTTSHITDINIQWSSSCRGGSAAGNCICTTSLNLEKNMILDLKEKVQDGTTSSKKGKPCL